MLACPICSASLDSSKTSCHACGFSAATRGRFVAWAPELADHNDGFHSGSFSGLAQVESENFWFRARNALIIWALNKYFPCFDSLLEVGCGTGFVLSGIAEAFPQARLAGSEIFVAGLEVAASRVPKADLVQMDARKLPYIEEFDLVAAFDVIEHIDEDETVLQNFFRAIKPGGGCVITVPQHKWLWSPEDEEACHKRRYSSNELHNKMEAAGFKILRTTSFVTLLLPAMLASRMNDKRVGKSSGAAALRMNKTINRLFESILYLERLVIKAGLNWPVGGSRLVIAQKPHAQQNQI